VKIRLADCLVSNYDLAGDNTPTSTNRDSPLDATIDFARIEFTYTVARTGETVSAIFDSVERT